MGLCGLKMQGTSEKISTSTRALTHSTCIRRVCLQLGAYKAIVLTMRRLKKPEEFEINPWPVRALPPSRPPSLKRKSIKTRSHFARVTQRQEYPSAREDGSRAICGHLINRLASFVPSPPPELNNSSSPQVKRQWSLGCGPTPDNSITNYPRWRWRWRRRLRLPAKIHGSAAPKMAREDRSPGSGVSKWSERRLGGLRGIDSPVPKRASPGRRDGLRLSSSAPLLGSAASTFRRSLAPGVRSHALLPTLPPPPTPVRHRTEHRDHGHTLGIARANLRPVGD
jgi:hypothetical protein